MGRLKHEGDAIDVVSPGTSDILKGELYRIDGWTGIAMAHVLTTDPELGFALEVSNRIWYVQLPNITAARGDLLYWSSGTGFKVGSTDLIAGPGALGQMPCAIVEEAKDANNIAAIRVLNFGASVNAGT